jgi:beta-phosphoglucomutase
MLTGVIFDVDGVLVDSYRAHFESWRIVAREHGVEFSEADFAASFGRRSRDIIGLWPGAAGLSAEIIAAIDARKEAVYRSIVSAQFPPMEGAAELIDDLATAGFRLAVGSSGPPENIELVLDRLGRRHQFQAVVTGRDVTRGKPDPQVYTLAAEGLKLPPPCCVVIEDAPAGIAAAHAARMPAVAILSTGRHERDFDAEPPEAIARSLRELSARALNELVRRGRKDHP